MSTTEIPIVVITEGGDTAALSAALAKAIARASAVGKDAENTYHRYSYASAEGLIAEARAALAAEGLSVLPKCHRLIRIVDAEARIGPDNKPLPAGYFADLETTYKVRHAGGGWEICTAETPVICEKGRPEDKAVAAAKTYAIGYFLRDLLLLPRVDKEADVDQRADHDYEPRQRQQGGGQQRQENGNRGDNGSRGGARLPEPPGRQSSPPSPPPDATKGLAALAGAKNLTELEAAGQRFIAPMPDGPPKEAMRAAYRKRRDELSGPAPAATAASEPAAQAPVVSIDREWATFVTDIGALVKADTATWIDDDFGSEFASIVEGAGTIKDLEIKATPWIAAIVKRKGARIATMRASLTRILDERKAQLRATGGA